MGAAPEENASRGDIPRYNDEVAVGEDLQFQRKWWRFENAVWVFFLIVLVCDAVGLLGRGWLSKAQKITPDHAMRLNYEYLEREFTPSDMTFYFDTAAVHNEKITLFVSDSVVKDLNAVSISPEPVKSMIGDGGFTYEFPATTGPAIVQISVKPQSPGLRRFRVESKGSQPINATVFVFP